MKRGLISLVNLAALEHNLQIVQRAVPDKYIIAMVKADGYGHGLISVASALKKADALGVACLEEAVQLRQAGIKQRIILMEGFLLASELIIISQLNLEIVLHHDFQLNILKDYIGKPITCWIKIDTGMNRLGFMPKLLVNVVEQVNNNNHLNLFGIMTHFAEADVVNSKMTAKQITKFFNSIKLLSNQLRSILAISLANSAAILNWPAAHGDWVRPGIMLYGISPISNKSAKDFNLQPVMTLKTSLISIRLVKRGNSIGYGRRYICQEDKLIGVIGIGYGDGYPLNTPDGTPVLINGQYAKIIGRVSMDMAMIDLSDIHQPNIGMDVTLWGDGLPIEIVAKHIGTLSYELLTNLGSRVEKQTIFSTIFEQRDDYVYQ